MKKILFLAVILIQTFISCNKKDDVNQANFIPKNASMVVVFNSKNMNEKTNSNAYSFLDSALQNIPLNNNETQLQQVFHQFKHCINWNKNISFFVTDKLVLNQPNKVINLMANLENKDSFISTIKGIKNIIIQEDKDISYAILNNDCIVSWNKNIVIASYKINISNNNNITLNTDAAWFLADVKQYYSLNENISNIDYFNNLMKENADVYCFTNTISWADYVNNSLFPKLNVPFQLTQLNALLVNNYSTSTLNFLNGKIEAKSSFYPNQIIANLLKQYVGHTVSTNLLQHYPSQNINAVFSYAFNPEIIVGLLKALDVETLAEGALQQYNVTIKDVCKAFKGDINLIVSDCKFKEDTLKYFNLPSVNYMLELTINDKNSFQKLMDLLKPLNMVEETKNGYQLNPTYSNYCFLQTDESHVIIASNKDLYNQYMNNKNVNNANLINDLKQKSAAYYINFNTIFNGIILQDNTKNKVLNQLKNSINTFNATQQLFDGKAIQSNATLSLSNNTANSLLVMQQVFNSLFSVANNNNK